MKMKRMSGLSVIFLVICLLVVFNGCGSSSAKPSSQETSQVIENVELSEEEFVYHGVHMKIPDVLSMKQNENGLDEYSSEWKGTIPEGYLPGTIDCYLTYNDETDTWDTEMNGEYSPTSARIYYAEGDYEGRISEDTVVERKRINGIDVLLKKYTVDLEGGKNPVVSNVTEVIVILQSCVVDIQFSSTTEQFDAIFEECINSIWVEDAEIPDLTKWTQPEALQEVGLNTQAWEYHGLYMHMPDTYTLVKMDDGSLIWISDDGQSYIMMSTGTDTGLLMMDKSQWESYLSGLAGIQEVTVSGNGNFNSIYYGFVSYRIMQGTQLFRTDTIVFLPDQHAEETVLMTFLYSPDDKETDEMGNRIWETVHYADGWEGEGLLEVEPITMAEFEEKAAAGE